MDDDQKLIISKYVSKFVNYQPIDSFKAKEAIKKYYEMGKLPEPEIIFVDNVIEAMKILNFLNCMKDKKTEGIDNASFLFSKQFEQINKLFIGDYLNEIDHQINDGMMNIIDNIDVNALANNLHYKNKDEVYENINNVWYNIDEDIRKRIMQKCYKIENVKDVDFFKVNNNMLLDWNYLIHNSCISFKWSAMYEYYMNIYFNKEENDKIFLHKKDEKQKYFELQNELMDSHIYRIIPLYNICIAVGLPHEIKRDPLTARLHCVDGPAIDLGKNSKMYYLEGIAIKNKTFEKFLDKSLTGKEAMSIRNIEERFIILKYIGPENVLRMFDNTLISKSTMGNELYAIENLVPRRVVKLLKYNCSSTGRTYMKFVPFEFIDADAAQAWSHHYTVQEYYGLERES